MESELLKNIFLDPFFELFSYILNHFFFVESTFKMNEKRLSLKVYLGLQLSMPKLLANILKVGIKVQRVNSLFFFIEI